MTKELSAWEKYKQNLGETKPWDLLNSKQPRAVEELAAERFNTCLGCEFLIKLTSQCKKCGCIMPLKTKLENATCPIGKW
jgi:hypothetical protein